MMSLRHLQKNDRVQINSFVLDLFIGSFIDFDFGFTVGRADMRFLLLLPCSWLSYSTMTKMGSDPASPSCSSNSIDDPVPHPARCPPSTLNSPPHPSWSVLFACPPPPLHPPVQGRDFVLACGVDREPCGLCVCVCVCRVRHTSCHNTLQHTATHCNILQHTTTHCSTLQSIEARHTS